MIAALDLRFRGGETGDTSPEIDAFLPARSPRTSNVDPIGVVGDPRARAVAGPVHVFFQHSAYGIPALHDGERPLDLASWSLRPTVFGYLAQVDPASTRAPQRTAWVLGAFLPLVVATEVAAADAPTSVQRPKTVTGKAPPELPDAPPALSSEPSETPTEPTEPTADDPSEKVVAPDPFNDATPTKPPRIGANDRAILDAAWEGVDGFDVEVTLKGGGRMSGRVGAVQQDTFTLIQEGTGAVLVMSKSGIRSLRVRVSKPVPSKTGTGALVSGGILTAVGTPVFISGLVFVAVCTSCTTLHVPLLIIGGGMLGAGIPLLVRGTRLRDKYRSALEQRAFSWTVMPTRTGWAGGLRFRF